MTSNDTFAPCFEIDDRISILVLRETGGAGLLEGRTDCVVDLTAGVSDAVARLKTAPVDLVIAYFPISGWEPEELLEQLRKTRDSVPIIICDPQGGLPDAVRLIKLGAYEYLGSGTTDERLLEAALSAADETRRRQEVASSGAETAWRKLLVGDGAAMQDVCRVIRLIAARRCTVLVTGETGTGKEMTARALHMASDRAQLAMVAFNCSAIPANLLEAELFGHTRGAFTGATQQRIGRFEQAHNSTLFLDEVGDMPLDLQAKLLRALQEREIQRLGSSETIRVDVRLIAASNLNLLEKVRRGAFREDLYYRLNVVPIHVPPLRDRLSDIPILVHHFIEKICRAERIPIKRIHRETFDRLCSYYWPGNVRQLENSVEMAVVMSGDREILYPSDFPLPFPSHRKTAAIQITPSVTVPDHGIDFDRVVSQFERNILEQALRKTRGNKTLAADMLNLKRTTLISKLRSLQVAGAA